MQPVWRNLSDPIFERAIACPGAVALAEGDVPLNYRALADLVGRASAHVHDLGIEPGEPVALALPGGLDHVLLTFALLRVGAVPLEMAPRPVPLAMAALLRRLRVRRAFLAPQLPSVDTITSHVIGPNWRADLAHTAGDRRVARDQDAPHMLHIGCGPDGMPHAIVTTHRQWLARLDAMRRLLPDVVTPGRPPVLVLPGTQGHSALLFLMCQFGLGGRTLVAAGDLSAARLAGTLEAAGDAIGLLSPALFRALLAMPAVPGGRLPRLRGLFTGGRALRPDEKLAVAGRLTPNLYTLHASAAAGVVAVLAPAALAVHPASAGMVDPVLTFEVVDGEGRMQPPGVAGRVRLRGPGVAQGTVGASAAAAGFRDGWYYPDELGALAPSGLLRLTGRASLLVRRRGVDIPLPEVERLLRMHASVAAAAAVDLRAPGGETLLIGLVVSREAPAPEALAAHCRSAIPAALQPDRIHFVRTLPTGADGGPDRVLLRRLLVRAAQRLNGAPPGGNA